MILKIRNSYIGKSVSLLMIFIFMLTLNPIQSYSLTGGPAQPEFNSFTPIGTSDMVNLSSGDYSYNVPIMDVGGFPINLAYNSGITMDQEASWVGLGWDLSIGQINRQMRGLPDDFRGDKVEYENQIKPNTTVGGTFQFSPEAFGISFEEVLPEDAVDDELGFNFGLSAQYNTYDGMSLSPSLGASYSIAGLGQASLSVKSTPDGLVVSPNFSLTAKAEDGKKVDRQLGVGFGVSFNSRQGLSNFNMSTTYKGMVSRNAVKMKEEKYGNKKSSASNGSSKSFIENTYTPTVQADMASFSGTFNTAFGTELFGAEGEAEITGFANSQFLETNRSIKRAYGYEHTEKAPEDAILDFNREKDAVFTENSTNLPLTNYTYDLYNVSGQGVSGMFQAHRSQVGYVYDGYERTDASGVSGGLELGVGSAAHTGGDIEVTLTESESGVWENDNEALESFQPNEENSPLYEEVYFKNVGDLSADKDRDIYGDESSPRLSNYLPIRLRIDGGAYFRKAGNAYMRKGQDEVSSAGWDIVKNEIIRDERVARNQTILKVRAAEAESIMSFTKHGASRPHHTAGFIVTRDDGARYNYGQALYNTVKKEATFALGSGIGGSSVIGEVGDCSTGLVNYNPGVDNSIDNTRGNHYFNEITTPGYGHTFLLTSLISTDYADIDGVPGFSAGDFGSYTSFKYRDMGLYKWRVPFQKDKANYNEGLKTDPTDDQGSYSYGEKETSYIQIIETKTHVAFFHISERRDGFGVVGENGGIGTDSKMYKLDKISLYSRGEIFDDEGNIIGEGVDADGNITTTVEPIKEAHFEYDYTLCKGIPNNDGAFFDRDGDGIDDNLGGKLTLRSVYFTYRSSNMGRFSPYNFTYGDRDHDGDEDAIRNPDYNLKAYDIWGCYKPNTSAATCGPIDPLTAFEFNYLEQNDPLVDDYQSAWCMTDIEMPSGGNIQIDYESDDYQFVQNKHAMRMFKLAGAGDLADPTSGEASEFLFDPVNNFEDQIKDEGLLYKGNNDAEYLYFKLDEQDGSLDPTNLEDVELFQEKYIQEIEERQQGLVQFRMLMNMSNQGGSLINGDEWMDTPFDFINGYFEIVPGESTLFTSGGEAFGSVKMKTVNLEGGFAGAANVNPIAKSGWHFARKYLPRYVYGLPETNLDEGTEAVLNAIQNSIENLVEIFSGANGLLKSKKIARRFIPEKSWIRLGEPSQFKKGGGCRVSRIVMTDEWATMTGTEVGGVNDQIYGQEYSYELEGGGSSGVASYEPYGAKDNPFVQPVFVNVNRLLAPDENNYVEKPFGESFFPSPSVTYGRIRVRNLERVNEFTGQELTKHATGEVITEYYTSKDFPTLVNQTRIKVHEDHNPLIASLLEVNIVKHLTLSQGYTVHLNDMDGKMKSQRVFAEGQDDYISGVDYNYETFKVALPSVLAVSNDSLIDSGVLDNRVLTLNPEGQLEQETIGVEFATVNDFREKRSVTQVAGIDLNAAFYTIGPIPVIAPIPLPDYSRHVDQLRLATTTKIIHSYGVLREVVAHDLGASVSTKNLVWDSETGEVLVTETTNEYNDKYYSFNLPAHWNYEGMSQASINSGLLTGIEAGTGPGNFKSTDGELAESYFYPGDEVIIFDDSGIQRAWIDLITEGTDFSMMDADANDITISGAASLKVIRSGRRNIQKTSMGSIVLMENPIDILLEDGGGINPGFLETSDWDEYRIVNAGAVEFSDDWNLQCECGIDVSEVHNPYRFNERGTWRAEKSHLFLTGREHSDVRPDPRNDGFYNKFSPFYQRNEAGEWFIEDEDWTFTSEVTQFNPYGFEIENQDALGRFSAAQYGYNFRFPLAVGANTRYDEMGFDGFEDYNFQGCPENEHFGFRDPVNAGLGEVDNTESHTGRSSLKVAAGGKITKVYTVACPEGPAVP